MVIYTVFEINLRKTINIFLQGIPSHIDMTKVRGTILSVKGTKRLHDVHVWSIDGERGVFTGHVVVDENSLKHQDTIRKEIKQKLEKYHIEHSTIEIESEDFCSGTKCKEDFK